MTFKSRIVISSPFNSISDRPSSHRSAPAHIYKDMLERAGYENVSINYGGELDYSHFDVLAIYLGNDYHPDAGNSVNLFGGIQGYGGIDHLVRFSRFYGEVFTFQFPFPAYHGFIRDKIKTAEEKGTQFPQSWYSIDIGNLERMHTTSRTIKYPHLTDRVVIGDSHAISLYRPGWVVNSVPFQTLNGALKLGLETFIEDVRPVHTVMELEVYFGNIDIRHHICRLGGNNPDVIIDSLAERYVQACKNLPIPKIIIRDFLPIENESRKVPSTGFYKGKPFWGTWEERNSARTKLGQKIKSLIGSDSRIEFKEWTQYLLNDRGELDFKHMESPRSVHLSRASYPEWTGVPTLTKPIQKQTKANNTLEDLFE